MKPNNIPGVRIDGLTKRHGETLAVDGLSFEVNPREFFSILGPSGSGKTTTLRLIAGLIHPDSGNIFIDGQPMNGLPPNLRPVNTVFQQYALFPHMTVQKNVAFGLEMRSIARHQIETRVGEALELVKLVGKADRLPSELSGGEQQRVALARALINRPSVILLDEPLGALDQQLRQEMQRELKRIQSEVGITCICVTHHQTEALLMSDRVAIMKDGRLMQIGEPEELYDRPQSAFVANFVGQSNSLEGEVLRANEDCDVLQRRGLKPIFISRSADHRVGNRMVMLLRPEHLTLTREETSHQRENTLEVQINQTYYLGNEIQYVVSVGPSCLWIVRDLAQIDRTTRFRPGEKAFLRWDIRHAHVFPVSES